MKQWRRTVDAITVKDVRFFTVLRTFVMFIAIQVILKVLESSVSILMRELGLPDNPTPIDHLTQAQIIIGYCLVLIKVVISAMQILIIIAFLIFTIFVLVKGIKKSLHSLL